MTDAVLHYSRSFISPASENGLLRSASPDRTVWLYGRIPWSTSLLDGADDRSRQDAALRFQTFFDGLAAQVSTAGLNYRYMLSGQYRRFHILGCSMPVPFRSTAAPGTPLADFQSRYYSRVMVRRQFSVIGVPLQLGGDTKRRHGDTLMRRAMRGLNHLAYNVANGCPSFEEYEEDAERITRLMEGAGIDPFTTMDSQERSRLIADMEAWWVSRANSTSLPVLVENDHVHFFPDEPTTKSAIHLYEQGVPCERWGIREEYPATIFFAKSTDFTRAPLTDPTNLWFARLLADGYGGGAGAVGVSVRGRVEPANVTEGEIRRNARSIDANIRDRAEKNREPTGEMEDLQRRLHYKREIYSIPDMPPSIVDMSIAVCVAGKPREAVESLTQVPRIEFVNLATAKEQLYAFKSMQACSPFEQIPFTLLPTSPMVSGAGESSLAYGGDHEGALLGFSETNRQPVYVGATTAQEKDMGPYFAIIGNTGSGKTMLGFGLALQWSKIRSRVGGDYTSVIYINPKTGDDLEDSTRAQGGTVRRLDSDLADGTLDPFNVMANREEAKEMAVLMLTDILDGDTETEGAISAMLNYGVRNGARCAGTALKRAADHARAVLKAGRSLRDDDSQLPLPDNTLDTWRTISMMLQSNQGLRLIFGTRDDIEPLRVSSGLTLLNAGQRSLVPEENDRSMVARIRRWTLRMTVLGAANAVMGRDGVVMVDEAWVFMGGDEGAGRTLAQFARTARSQRFMLVLMTQKVQEFIDAGLTGAISRSCLLSLNDPVEKNGAVSDAKSALRLLNIDDASGHIRNRMRLGAEKPNKKPEYGSLLRLRRGPVPGGDPDDYGPTVRGAIAYFKDGSNQPFPVEIYIPKELLDDISTNPLDKDRRARERMKGRNQ